MAFPQIKNAFGFPAIYINDITSKALEDGEMSPILVDNYRRIVLSPTTVISTTPSSPSVTSLLQKMNYSNAAAGVSATAVATRVYNGNMVNRTTNIIYVQLHNKATAPVGGDACQIEFEIPANGGSLILDTTHHYYLYEYFSLGLGIAISSTPKTFTVPADFTNVDVWFKYSSP